MTLDYIAGFFDAEGSISLYLRTGRRAPIICLEVVNVHRPTLEQMRKFTGIGRVERRYKGSKKRLGHQDQWRWRIDGATQACTLLRLLLPHLIQKRNKATEAIATRVQRKR